MPVGGARLVRTVALAACAAALPIGSAAAQSSPRLVGARVAASVAATTTPAAAPAAAPAVRPLPASALAVRTGGGWREWWRSDAAPARWDAPLATVAGAVLWRAAAPGVEWGELSLAGSGEAWRLRVIVARIDPARARLRLDLDVRDGGQVQPWSVERAPATAAVALNAGQFTDAGPWGWLVRDGRELLRPGRGPLAPALVVDDAGRARFVPADSIEQVRRAGGVREAFQSYPALLAGDGLLPAPLQVPGRGVDLGHRDARLAIGTLRDGRVLVALTRFEGLGGVLEALPFGLTVPEMAAVMGALGAQQAMLLDGGISGQLLVRDATRTHEWSGLRKVPLGIVVESR